MPLYPLVRIERGGGVDVGQDPAGGDHAVLRRAGHPCKLEPSGMSVGPSRLSAPERASDLRSRSRLHDLFTPLDTLLVSGGDPRLVLDPTDRVNAYGCAASPEPEIWNFASSNASTISQSAWDCAALAREELMRKCLFEEVDVVFDTRCEGMRDELRGHFQLSP